MAKCGCGRSTTGECVGLHKLTTEEWLKKEQEQKLQEQQQFLTESE